MKIYKIIFTTQNCNNIKKNDNFNNNKYPSSIISNKINNKWKKLAQNLLRTRNLMVKCWNKQFEYIWPELV